MIVSFRALSKLLVQESSIRWGYIKHQHWKTISLSAMSEFDNFDVDNLYPTSPFKGCNIVDLDFMYEQLLDGCKACKTHYPVQNVKEKV